MPVIWLQVFNSRSDNPADKAISVSIAEDLSSFSFWQRPMVREHVTFAARTSTERCEKGTRTSISLREIPFKCHVYRRTDGLASVCMADNRYPDRVAHSLLSVVLREFDETFGTQWLRVNTDTQMDMPSMRQHLTEYQNPAEADKLMRLEKNLDEIKEIMQKNIEEVLRRGEKLDDLMSRSEDIGELSNQFYKKAKKNNQCCTWY